VSLVLDTGAIYAFYDSSDTWHERVRDLLEREPGQLFLPSLVIPEADYLLGKRLNEQARLAFLEDIVLGVFTPVDLPAGTFEDILALNKKFADLELGVVDASVVVVAQLLGLNRVATIDRRHFVPLARTFSLELLP
jgi:uncharacterized protein